MDLRIFLQLSFFLFVQNSNELDKRKLRPERICSGRSHLLSISYFLDWTASPFHPAYLLSPGKTLQPLYEQGPDRVEHRDDHNPHIRENGKPHIGDAHRAEHQADQLNADGEPDIFVYNAKAFS